MKSFSIYKYKLKRSFFRLIPIRLTSQDWQVLFHEIKVLDADGWNRHPDEFDHDWYGRKISFKEYEGRIIKSTREFRIPLHQMI